jgi:hypothetical protein
MIFGDIVKIHECQVSGESKPTVIAELSIMGWVLMTIDNKGMLIMPVDFCPYCGHCVHDDEQATAKQIAKEISEKRML